MRIYYQIDIGNILHMWGNNNVLAYDSSESIEHTQFVCYYFTLFKESSLHIYMDLVKNGVLAFLHDDERFLNPIGGEIFKPCAYHDAIDHSISKCLGFRYDL